ncbi:hypothetical protein AA0472_0799 [Acetobacter estunensis NRIC 0472]|uniref:Uncharacterized protein n=1 Tax=Acetobacter estunensis TaxID=104097 RepID=A0A967B6R6_9PROT|nr:hypothetical protein [Acetobacter estunensis]GBQ22531.1 hypothetical protein AA0472_0799 [Acetobacter estunensis NRIC 0472]
MSIFRFRLGLPVAILAMAAVSGPLAHHAMAAPGSDPFAGVEMTSGDPTKEDPSSAAAVQSRQHEHVRVRGRRKLPPGYQDAPSMELSHGPDPDHAQHVTRDAVTGADLSKFGSAYQDSGPTGTGSLGDSTGNGWVAPR